MKKKIWFDLSNSPHINLFMDLIRELEREYEIVITTRNLGSSIQLLEREKFVYKSIGKYYKKNKLKKTYAFVDRIVQLKNHLKKENITLAVSQSSFHSPPVAKLIGSKALYMNDNEHAQGNIPAFLFADKILLPEYFPSNIASKQLAQNNKILYYPGLKEGIYLWNKPSIFYKKNENTNNKKIYIRPEPWTAMYYKGRKNFLDSLIAELENDGFNMVLIPRDSVQLKHYKSLNLRNLAISEGNSTLEEITNDCLLFIGAGGTMTREMAILGFPTISVYQDELLQVDKFLLKSGLLMHSKNIDKRFVLSFLSNHQSANSDILLQKGKEAYYLLKGTIINMMNEE